MLSLIGIGLAASAIIMIRRLAARFDATFGGDATQSLETTLTNHMAEVGRTARRLGELESEYERLSITNAVASQKISVVRFNPFEDTGGDQSFSLAVLDAHDSGYVLSSIHGRQGTRVYVKPIDFGKSKYQLSAEEQQSLAQAAKRVPELPTKLSKEHEHG
jgi:hypothetical protein